MVNFKGTMILSCSEEVPHKADGKVLGARGQFAKPSEPDTCHCLSPCRTEWQETIFQHLFIFKHHQMSDSEEMLAV